MVFLNVMSAHGLYEWELNSELRSPRFLWRVRSAVNISRVMRHEGVFAIYNNWGSIRYSDMILPRNADENMGMEPPEGVDLRPIIFDTEGNNSTRPDVALILHSHYLHDFADYSNQLGASRGDLYTYDQFLHSANPEVIFGIAVEPPLELGRIAITLLRASDGYDSAALQSKASRARTSEALRQLVTEVGINTATISYTPDGTLRGAENIAQLYA